MISKKLEIIVGGGTCGKAAGSDAVLSAFKQKIPSAIIRSVGCKGVCHQEVITEILDGDKYFLYGKLNTLNIDQIIDFHIGNGEMPEKLLISSSETPELESAKYLKKQKRIALRNVGEIDPTSIHEYINRGGYKAIEKILKENITAQDVINEVKVSELKGRGGGGFPTYLKWQFAKDTTNKQKYLICNGDEGDPGAFMDRSLLEGDPHSVVEGMLIAAFAISASKGYAYIRAEYPLAVKNFKKAIDDATQNKFLGSNILGSNFSFHLQIKQGAGAFVCGEETALIASIEGERGMPRIRPPYPAIRGLFNGPTIINNVETLSNLPWIITNGGAEYSKFGTEDSKGTKVFALAGAIKRGGLVEVPMGVTIREVIDNIGGGSDDGSKLKAVQLGGPSGGCIPENMFDTPIGYKSINETGAIMGSGGMIVMNEKSCMVDLARYFLEFTQLESCGKCTFCRIGTLRMKELLVKICEGNGEIEDLKLLEDLAPKIKEASLCGLGQTAPNPVLTTLKYFKEEYIEHINDKKCRAAVCKNLITHEILKEKCTTCSICKKQCPVDAISGTPKEIGSFVINQHTCINCGMCLEVCRADAITVR